jgi:hypothetical protein
MWALPIERFKIMEKGNEILANFFMTINLTMDGKINRGIFFMYLKI